MLLEWKSIILRGLGLWLREEVKEDFVEVVQSEEEVGFPFTSV